MTDKPATTASDNPLLLHGQLPAFDRVQPSHVVPAVRKLLPEMLAAVEAIEKDAQPTWEGVVARPTDAMEPLGFAWSVVSHLLGVKNSPELREAHQTVQPEVVTAFMQVSQS